MINMQMKRLLVFILIIFLTGCEKEDETGNVCNPENPFQMEWFSEWIEELQQCACTISIFQAEYDGGTVFWQLMTDPLCQAVVHEIRVYSCTGSELIVLDNYNDLMEFHKQVSDMKIVYNCPTPHD